MASKLVILVCHNFEAEVTAACRALGFDDVVVVGFPVRCRRGLSSWQDVIHGVIEQVGADCEIQIVGSFGCLPPDENWAALGVGRVHKLDQCFHLFLNNSIVDSYLDRRAHLVTPGWLHHWRQETREWGLDRETARDLFGKFATTLTLLDTGVDPHSRDNLQEFADFVGLPSEVVPVGLDHLELFLTKQVQAWRLENEKRKSTVAVNDANRPSADYAMVIDLIGNLTEMMTEAEAVDRIFDVFAMLFAPGRMIYLPLVEGRRGRAQTRPAGIQSSGSMNCSPSVCVEGYAWTESGTGFCLCIGHQGETVGMLEVDDIPFSEYKEHYLNLALAVGGVLGLAISNARAYERAQEIGESLARERERLAVTLRSIGDGVITTDTEGRVVSLNGIAENLTGWTQAEAAGRPLKEVFRIINEKTREESENPVEKALTARVPVEIANDMALIAKDGTERIISDSAAPILSEDGEVLGVILVFRDGTAQKKVEQELRTLSRAVEQNPCTIVITDVKGAIEYVNPKFTELSGYTFEEAVGQNPRILKSGEMSPDGYKELWQSISSGHEWRGEFHNKKKNGDLYWESASISPVRDAEGVITHFIAVKEDITERKRIEAEREHLLVELERRATELDASNKELEAFSYSVSHDLRAPLRAVDGFSLALLEDHADRLDDEGKHYLESVRRASQRMAQLIDDLLSLSRITRAEMHRDVVDLSEMARSIADELHRTQPDRRVEFRIAPQLEAVGDVRLLRIALENLLGNAWKFTSKNEQALIEFGVTQHEGRQAYYVRDDGAGFDMAYSDKLFGAFQRLHGSDEFPGTGIGLATVQRIIHRHGGKIWAVGAANKGATFYFTLPSS